MPNELKIVGYPMSYRYYDSVPLIFSRYIAAKAFKIFLENMFATFASSP